MTVFSRVTSKKSIPISLGKGRGKSSEQSSEVVNLKVKARERLKIEKMDFQRINLREKTKPIGGSVF